jgi:hypothetical protein
MSQRVFRDDRDAGHLVLHPGSGHSRLTMEPDLSSGALRAWMAGYAMHNRAAAIVACAVTMRMIGA